MEVKYLEDYNLVHKYLCNDRNAGEQLYGSIFVLVKKTIYRITNGSGLTEQDKEEIISDTFNTSIEKLRMYDGSCKFSTFVIGIGQNKIKEKLRLRKRLNQREESGEVTDSIIQLNNYYNQDPLKIVINCELRKALNDSRDFLKTDYQKLINLKQNKMKNKDIAALFGLSEEAIESAYRRAIQAWKKKFNEIYKKNDGK